MKRINLILLFLCLFVHTAYADYVEVNVDGSEAIWVLSGTDYNGFNFSGAWYSSNPSVAELKNPNASGSTNQVIGKSQGTTTITCRYTYTNKQNQPDSGIKTWTVKVKSVSPTSISLNSTNVSLQVGGTKQLTAAVSPSGASQGVTWSVYSGSSYASVNSSGLVTAKAAGTATIRATSTENSSVYKDCTVTVTEPVSPTSITLNTTSTSLTVGDTRQLTATVFPSGVSQSVTWSVYSGSSYVSVNSSGLVTAKAAGTATIRATSTVNSSVYKNCTVTVTEKELADGDVFTGNTKEGVSMKFEVTSASDKTCKISIKGSNSCINRNTTGTVTIPAEVNGYYVTSIGICAFSGCSGLTSIIIPNSITSIGISAFQNCSGLTSITIPNSVTSIGQSTFYACSGLTSITIPNSVTSIGQEMFYACSGLTSITIPNSVTSIGGCAFSGCSSLTGITIPNSVTSIGGYAFSGCSSLTGITIPNSVTYIGERVFANCNSLTSITIPNSVTSIGEGSFFGCNGLTSMQVDSENVVYDSRNNCNAIIESSTNTLLYGCITTIIPNSVTSIGDNAFYGFSGLTCITIPNSVTSIGVGAFCACSGLTSITIPNSVTSIRDVAFADCSNLTSITIPNSVISIGSYAFDGCNNLISVTVGWDNPIAISSYCFNNAANATLYVPKGSKAAYEAADYWNEFKEIVEMEGDDPDVFTAESIGGVQMTFKITDEANKICQIGTGNGVAINVSTMGEIILPPTANGYTVTSIADNAFANCTSIYCVYIPNTIQSIGENAFNDCTMLSSVKSYIEKPFDIPASAFANISSYASLDALYGTKEKYQTVTGWNVFYSIYAETAIVNGIRYSVNGAVPEDKGEAYTAWVNRAIWNNYEGEVVIPEVLTIGDESFTVVGIDGGAFYNSQITSVTIPSTVRSIDSNAFENCLALNSITSYIMEPQDESGSFVNIPADATLYVPAGTKSLYENAGGWNQFTTIIEMEAEDPNPDPDPEQIEVTDISQLDNAIYIEATEGLVGSTIDLCVKVKNVLTPVGCSFKLKLPDGLSLKTDEDGDVIYTLNDRGSKMNNTSKNWGNGIYDFALTPRTGTATISGQDGIVITFKLQIPDDMVAGAYKVSLTNCLIQSKADGVTRDYELSDVVTTLTVEDYEPGDVNGDGNITPSDAIMILYRYFNVEQAGFNEKAADLNGDGNITPSDAIETLYLYFGSSHSNNAPRRMEPVREPE